MVVSVRDSGRSTAFQPFAGTISGGVGAPTADMGRVSFHVANHTAVTVAYGATVAEALVAEITDRATAFLGTRGVAVWREADRLDLVFRDPSEPGMSSAARFIETALRAIAGRPVRCGTVDVLPALKIATGRASVPARDPDFSPKRYVQDMAVAVRVADDIRCDALLLAWQPIVACGPDATLLHHRAVPRIADGDHSETSSAGVRSAFRRVGTSGLFDSHVVRATIEQLRKQSALTLACGIAAASTADHGWWETVFAILRREPEIARRLIVEIDQTAPFPSITQAVIFIDQLRQLGCRIAIDNFGAGQTAISHLPVLSPDMVTIDGIFLRHPSGRGALEHLVGLARGYAPVVLVNGVDGEMQARIVAETGAHGMAGRQIGSPRLTLVSDAPVESEAPEVPEVRIDPVDTEICEPHDLRLLRRGLLVSAILSGLLWWGIVEALRLIA
jgi:EAL domain-containing protein (putative c-di-GMP-specific phosphodiesterase class I)